MAKKIEFEFELKYKEAAKNLDEFQKEYAKLEKEVETANKKTEDALKKVEKSAKQDDLMNVDMYEYSYEVIATLNPDNNKNHTLKRANSFSFCYRKILNLCCQASATSSSVNSSLFCIKYFSKSTILAIPLPLPPSCSSAPSSILRFISRSSPYAPRGPRRLVRHTKPISSNRRILSLPPVELNELLFPFRCSVYWRRCCITHNPSLGFGSYL